MNRKALMAKGLLALIAEFAVFATLLFVAAGTVLWSAGWVFMAIFFGFSLAITLWVGHESPELLAERLAAPIQRDQPLWDKVFVAAVMPLFVVWLILMPLDAVRFGWSQMPGWLQVMGALALVLSLRSVLDLPGDRVSRTRSESSRGEGPNGGDFRPIPVREASHVWEHVLVFAGKCTPVGLLVGLVALPGDSGPTCLEDHPRRADAEERPGRIRRVRTAG
jgi:protein-S-isoprenylcysteine O-methyltransferase Ste14